MRRPIVLGTLVVSAVIVLSNFARAEDIPYEGVSLPGVSGYSPRTVEPGPGASGAKNPADARGIGARWLTQHQNSDGGWASGGWGGEQAGSDVATTAVAVMALRRDGANLHPQAIKKGIDFVLTAVETAPKQGPLLNTPQGTQPQYKLGPNVDTHLASVLLTDVSGKMDPATNKRITAALDVVIGKVQQAQSANGSFESTGWAPAISSSFATQGLSAAAELGRDVDEGALRKNDDWQRAQVSADGSFDTSAGAGVSLYSVATGLANATSAKGRGGEAMEAVATKAAAQASPADTAFIAGFGSIGGEEVLSYMMIGDSLHKQDPKKAAEWDKNIGGYLTSIQNADGSWSGHHCITSTPFTTAAAVMALGAGNVEVPSRGASVPAEPSSWWTAQATE